LKAFSDLVNLAAEGRKFVSVHKSDVHKSDPIAIPFLQYTLSSRSRGKEMMVTITNAAAPDEKIHVLLRMGMVPSLRDFVVPLDEFSCPVLY
jgi:hypothetical protein